MRAHLDDIFWSLLRCSLFTKILLNTRARVTRFKNKRNKNLALGCQAPGAEVHRCNHAKHRGPCAEVHRCNHAKRQGPCYAPMSYNFSDTRNNALWGTRENEKCYWNHNCDVNFNVAGKILAQRTSPLGLCVPWFLPIIQRKH